jgi:hypothetical protein
MKNYAKKTYVGVDVYIHVFLPSALVGDKWSASPPGRFTARERALGTHWTGSCVEPRTSLDAVEYRKYFRFAGTRTPAIHHIARRYTD